MNRASIVVAGMATLAGVLTACSSNATVSLIDNSGAATTTTPATTLSTSIVATTTDAEVQCMKAVRNATLVAVFVAPAASVVDWQEHRYDGRTSPGVSEFPGSVPVAAVPAR